jgi:D-alanyl-D-alanine dipeptidase
VPGNLRAVIKRSIAEPVSHLRRIPIRECGEPLVNFLDYGGRLFLDEPRWDYHRETLLRESVAKALAEASKRLPRGYSLAVIEGWRPRHIQRRMYLTGLRRWREMHPEWSETHLRRVVNRFSAPPDYPKVPPPHLTGGALDVLLADNKGRVLNHSEPYAPRDPKSYLTDAPGLTSEARRVRTILKETLESVGITNYPSEFWHYSYGDQGWAYRGGKSFAIYGATEPPGYVPPPQDLVDEPLTWVGPTE